MTILPRNMRKPLNAGHHFQPEMNLEFLVNEVWWEDPLNQKPRWTDNRRYEPGHRGRRVVKPRNRWSNQDIYERRREAVKEVNPCGWGIPEERVNKRVQFSHKETHTFKPKSSPKKPPKSRQLTTNLSTQPW